MELSGFSPRSDFVSQAFFPLGYLKWEPQIEGTILSLCSCTTSSGLFGRSGLDDGVRLSARLMVGLFGLGRPLAILPNF